MTETWLHLGVFTSELGFTKYDVFRCDTSKWMIIIHLLMIIFDIDDFDYCDSGNCNLKYDFKNANFDMINIFLGNVNWTQLLFDIDIEIVVNIFYNYVYSAIEILFRLNLFILLTFNLGLQVYLKN